MLFVAAILFLGGPSTLSAQSNSGYGTCSGLAEALFLSLALSLNGGAVQESIGFYQNCTASAQALPPSPVPPTASCSGYEGACSANIILLDPVPDLINQAGNGVTTDAEALASGGTEATGIAAGRCGKAGALHSRQFSW